MKKQRYIIIAILLFLAISVSPNPVFLNAQEAQAAVNDLNVKSEEEQVQIAVLQSDAQLFDKVTACRKLTLIGTKKSVPVLAGLLDDDSLGDYARIAMERIEDPSVDDAFREALDKCQGRLLVGVVNSIGARRDVQAVSLLSKLASDSAAGVRAEALAALGMIATDEAVAIILHVMTTGPEMLRSAAADAALRCAEYQLSQSKQKKAVELYETVRKADVSEHLYTAATYGEIRARGTAGLPLLIKQLKTDNYVMINVALRAARELPGPEVTEALVAELGKLQPNIQILLIKVLADRKGPKVSESLEALAASDNPEVRAESLKVLGKVGNVSSVGVLLAAVKAGGEDATIALSSLRMIKGGGVNEAIVGKMKIAQSDEKVELIKILSDRNASVAVDAVFAEAQSPDSQVRSAAFKALANLAGPDDVGRVVNLVRALEDTAGRKEAERAVISVAGKITDKSTRTDIIIAALKQEKKVDARCSLLRILSSFSDDKSFQIIKSSLGDENEQVKDTAVRAITAWPDSDALETLFAIFKGTNNQTHRVLALRSYVRLLRQDKQIASEKKVEILGEIIKQVDTTAEKKNILSSLASMQHSSALTIAEQYLSNPQVKNEAELATIQIAQSIAGAWPVEAKAAALEIVKTTSDDALRNQARALVKTIEGFEDFITDWQVSGPYLKAGKNYSQLFDTAFAPETGDEDVDWSPMPAGTNAEKPWMLDLLKLYPGNNRIAYVYSWVQSSIQQKARLELGSDDGVKVWLNDKVVHANNIARAAIPGSDKVDVQLQKGWNKLMLKVTQNTSSWEFCLRLRDAAGNKLENITVDSFHQEQPEALFDGKTFTGWEGDLKWFRIQDGAIVAGKLSEDIPHNFFLATTKKYYNFELCLKVKTSASGVNGGIQLRSQRAENHHEVKGFQADLGQVYWGGLYDEARRNRFLVAPDEDLQKTIKHNEWNVFKIRCVNDRIQIFLNGVKTVDYIEADPEIAKQAGIIAIQIHGGQPAEAWYKDITIKEL
ncbi:MAG: DUF1080 domain-containing protein [Sedimentisphaerales bacterium]|nr:DUF1080 domain-containing protein [Sedimentisphaerales bacterium]